MCRGVQGIKNVVRVAVILIEARTQAGEDEEHDCDSRDNSRERPSLSVSGAAQKRDEQRRQQDEEENQSGRQSERHRNKSEVHKRRDEQEAGNRAERSDGNCHRRPSALFLNESETNAEQREEQRPCHQVTPANHPDRGCDH